MHWKRMFPDEKYLGAWDLEGHSGAVVVIDRVEVEELKSQRGTDHKPVAYFRGKKKGMVLNKTNCKTIATLYGQNADGWLGKAVEIFATTCSAAGGETVECLRIRPRKPAMPVPGKPVEPEQGPQQEEDAR